MNFLQPEGEYSLEKLKNTNVNGVFGLRRQVSPTCAGLASWQVGGGIA
jgi:hypothetical protein